MPICVAILCGTEELGYVVFSPPKYKLNYVEIE